MRARRLFALTLTDISPDGFGRYGPRCANIVGGSPQTLFAAYSFELWKPFPQEPAGIAKIHYPGWRSPRRSTHKQVHMVNIRLKCQDFYPVLFTALHDQLFAPRLNITHQHLAPVFRYPDEVVCNLVVSMSGAAYSDIFHSGLQGSKRTAKIISMQTAKIHYLKNLDASMFARLKTAQMESAKVWNICKDLHLEARKSNSKWPTQIDLQIATKGKAEIHSQSVQMVCQAFIANVDTTRQLRQHGYRKINYPWRTKTFYPVLWPAQAVKVKEGRLILPRGRGREALVFNLGIEQAGAVSLVWNYGFELHIKQPAGAGPAVISDVHATVDLGEVHLAAVTTNTGEGVIIPGRDIRSIKRYRQKSTGEIQRKLSRCTKGSRRYKKLTRAKHSISSQTGRQVKDLRHKATRRVTEFCKTHGVSKVYIGNPDGVRSRDTGSKHNDRMSKWEYGKDIDHLTYKLILSGISVVTGTERGTSSHCPNPKCNHRHKPKGRNWHCKKCGFRGHRDLVGSVNMHPIGFGEVIAFPTQVTYLRAGRIRQAWAHEDPQVARSSCPDTGQRCLVSGDRQALNSVRVVA
jgi:transposase, IS605 OrfB family, central region